MADENRPIVFASFKVAGVVRVSPDPMSVGMVTYECSHNTHTDFIDATKCAENALRVIQEQEGSTDIQLPEGWFRT